MKYFPLFIQAEHKSIVIFGGGRDAAAKLRLVLKTKADVIVVAEQLETSEIQLETATWQQIDPLLFKIPSNTAFAYAATGDKKLDAQIALKVREAGVLVCAADQPDVSDFSTPAIVDRDPVIVAIGTEGTAPVLARSIKAEVEALLPIALGKAAELAANLRPWVAKRVAGGLKRREFWQGFFKAAPSTKLEARKLVNDLVTTNEAGQVNEGVLSFVGAGPGDADLLTLKARKALDRADVVLYAEDVSSEILELARREALMVPMIGVSNQSAVNSALAAVNEGENVVWISARTPDPSKTLSVYQQAVHQDQLVLIPGVVVAEDEKKNISKLPKTKQSTKHTTQRIIQRAA